MPGLRTLAVLTDLGICVEQDEFRNSTELHADGSNSRSGRLLEIPFSNSAFSFLSMSPCCNLRAPAHCGVQLGGRRVLKDARTTARVIQTVLICPYGSLDLSSTQKRGSEMEGFIMKRGGPPLTPPSPSLATLALASKCLARSDKSRRNSTG